MATIEIQSVECVPASDGVEDEEISSQTHPNNQYPSKPHILLSSAIAPTSVHELLECPVCTNFMYPPIHQV